ncbi:hypothetical protein D3C75_966510 [compost metagenome]
MRKYSRGKVQDIGGSGEKIATFLHGLSKDEKEEVIKKIGEYIPYISEIKTKKKSLGWTSFELIEKYKDNNFTIESQYLSDGLLRIVALAAINKINEKSSIFLLDEIEDGLNPHLAANLVNDLVRLTEQNNRQVIVTTHSPLILNNFDYTNIVLIWRCDDGNIKAAPMFSDPELINYLEYMNPGEVWVNYDINDLIKIVDKPEVVWGVK